MFGRDLMHEVTALPMVPPSRFTVPSASHLFPPCFWRDFVPSFSPSSHSLVTCRDAARDAQVTNTGTMKADDVVLGFLSPPSAAGVPIQSLFAFERVSLAPKESKIVWLYPALSDFAQARNMHSRSHTRATRAPTEALIHERVQVYISICT
eukprot:6188789-Pleurochrysis_carterae.AAC.4